MNLVTHMSRPAVSQADRDAIEDFGLIAANDCVGTGADAHHEEELISQ